EARADPPPPGPARRARPDAVGASPAAAPAVSMGAAARPKARQAAAGAPLAAAPAERSGRAVGRALPSSARGAVPAAAPAARLPRRAATRPAALQAPARS